MFAKGVTLVVLTLAVFNNVGLMICADVGGFEGDPAAARCTAVCAAAAAAADRELEVARAFCKKFMNSSEGIPELDLGIRIGLPELICHDANNLTLRWKLDRPPQNSTMFFVVELETIEGDSQPRIYYNVAQTFISSFHDLPPGTSFNATVRAATLSGWSRTSSSSAVFHTHTLGHPPVAVSSVWRDQQLGFDGTADDADGTGRLTTTIYWVPSEDLTCAYELKMISDAPDYLDPVDAFTPERGYNAKFVNLKYDTTYTATVSAHFSEESSSASATLSFKTPTCLQYRQNLTVCVPSKPEITLVEENESSTVEDSGSSNKSYDIRITWKRPELQPDQYNITLRTDTNHVYRTNVNGSQVSAFFSTVQIKQTYIVYVEAASVAGWSKAADRRCDIKQKHDQLQTSSTSVGGVLLFAIAIPACSLLVCIALAAFIYRRHTKIKLYKKRCRYFEELERKAPPESCNVSIRCLTGTDSGLESSALGMTTSASVVADDRFELKPERLTLLEALGEGAFGLVRKALLLGDGDEKEVAVKMLKEHPTPDEARQFRGEIEMMKAVGSHPHIVSVLGCCTRAPPALLVVEFCARGDLQKYLRFAWEVLSSNRNWSLNTDYPKKTGYFKLESDSSVQIPKVVVNRLYDLDVSADTEITAVDLLSFSRQIAMGMEFLSSNRVVHRDLAARNVLVCADKTVKIADFGLSRDIYQDNIYKKTSGGKLPIKWMAIESLTHQIYTTHSDVWSFGVVLWEIVTLGGNPYPSVPTGRLLKLLMSGHRMECPANCSQELYGLMSSCWQFRPKNRPTFTSLRRQLDALLNGACSKDYLNLEVLQYKDIEYFRKDVINQPESDSIIFDKILPNCTDYKNSDSDWYVKPISNSSSKEALRTTQNHYSDMPMLSPAYPAPSSLPLGTANRNLLC